MKRRTVLAVLLAAALLLASGCAPAAQEGSSAAQEAPKAQSGSSEAREEAPEAPGEETAQGREAPEAPEERETEDVPALMLAESVRLTGLMGEMAGSEGYRAMYTSSEEIGGRIEGMAGAYGAPVKAYRVTLSGEAAQMLLTMAEVDLGTLSPELRRLLFARMTAATPSMINAQGGSEQLAAASCVTASSNLRTDGLAENTLVLLCYEGEFWSMTSFLPDGNGVVDVSASFIPAGELEADAAPQAVSEWLTRFGVAGEAEAYTAEELAALPGEGAA